MIFEIAQSQPVLEHIADNLFLPLLIVMILESLTRTFSLHFMQYPVSLMLVWFRVCYWTHLVGHILLKLHYFVKSLYCTAILSANSR